MDERTMFELLEIYDAVNRLCNVQEMLVGVSYGVGPGEGILGDLSYVTEIIARYSPLYDSNEDHDTSYFWRIMENRQTDNHKKAQILLGMPG